MNTPVPPHYTAYRVAILVLLVAALAAAARWLLDPTVSATIAHFLGRS